MGHYSQWRRVCGPAAPVTKPGKVKKFPTVDTDEEYFWLRVEKTNSCWRWTGTTDMHGYGKMKHAGKRQQAHRFSWSLTTGAAIPERAFIDHLCHNPNCVNPAHLRLATHKENMENRKGAGKNSTSGVRGVHQPKGAKTWRAQVGHNGSKIYLGRFKTLEEAEQAVIAARKCLWSVTN